MMSLQTHADPSLHPTSAVLVLGAGALLAAGTAGYGEGATAAYLAAATGLLSLTVLAAVRATAHRSSPETDEEGEGPTPRSSANRTLSQTCEIASSDDSSEAAGGRMAGVFEDEAQQRRAAEALQHQGACLLGLADSLPGVVCQFYARPEKTDGLPLDTAVVTPQAEDILGIPPAPTGFSDRLLDRVRASHRRELIQAVEEAVETGDPWQVEVPVDVPSRGPIWLLATFAPEKRDGALLYNGVFLDVTERKQQEQQRKAREQQLRAFTENVSEGFYRTTPDRGLTYANSTFVQMMGYDEASALLQVPPNELYADRDARSTFRAAVRGTDTFEKVDVAFRRKDGSTLIGRLHGTVVRDAAGRIECCDVAVRDVTEEKETQRVLERERDRLETLFESLPTPVARCTVEPEGTIIADANEAFETIFGEEGTSVEGTDANALLRANAEDEKTPKNEGTEIDRRVLEEGTIQKEVRRQTVDGPRDFRLQAAGRQGEEGPPELYAIYTDITEQKRYKRELETLTTRLELALEATDTGVWEWDLSSDEIYWDDASKHLFGYEPGAFPGTYAAFLERVDPADHDRIDRALRRTLETGARFRVDFRIEGPDGERRWIESQGLLRPQDGEPQRLIGIQTDITDRKERERELRRRERRYQAILSDPNILAGVLSPDGTLVEANETAMGYVEADRDEVLGRPFWETPWWDEATRSDVRSKVKRAARGEYVEYEAVHDTPDGGEHIVSGSIRPVRDRAGEVVSLVVSAKNITERKRRERQAQRRSDAMEAASDGMAVLGPDGTYRYVNQAHADIYGYDAPEAFLGETWTMCYERDELQRFQETVMPALEEQGQWRGRALGRRADGSSFPQELTLTALDDGGIICVVRDVTQQKEKERALKEAKEEAEAANRLKSAFLANVSHEVRTPLTSIIGFAEAIGEEASAAEEAMGDTLAPLVRFAHLIEQSGQRLMDTLNGVLNLAKLEAGEMEFAPEQVDVLDETVQTAEQLQPRADEQGVSLQVEADASSVDHWVDPEGVRIILRNLLSNAIKYTEAGGKVWVRVRREEEEAVLEVEDTGIGMDPQQIAGLFQPFRQASEGLAREYEGTGLGLSITKEVVDQMGGTIDVETKKNEGTRFRVGLPTAQQDATS